MSYKSILVNLDVDGPVLPLIEFAIDFARFFEARLIGFSAAQVRLPFAGPDGSAFGAEAWAQERDGFQRSFEKLRREFRKQVAGKVETGWHDMLADPTRCLAETARLADIIVTTARQGASIGDPYRSIDPGSLVLQAGRPVLIAANDATRFTVEKVVIAWKDTRESRRAVADAIPLLQSASEVVIVSVDRDPAIHARIADVSTYLQRHRVKAHTEVIVTEDEADRIHEFVTTCDADLVISGAYGHSRLSEWAFGGVTRSLLNEVRLNRLMAS